MTEDFWDRRAQRYNDDIEKQDVGFAQTVESAKSLLSPSDVVLDLGCASGEFSVEIAPYVQSVHGIDTSTNMIAMAKRKATSRSVDNVVFDPIDVFDRALDASSYTAVLAFNLLHLVENMGAVLGRINQLLPPGGLLIAQTPCLGERGLMFKMFVGIAQKLNIAPPILSLSAHQLEAEIEAAEFDITESTEWDTKDAIRRIVARKRRAAS